MLKLLFCSPCIIYSQCSNLTFLLNLKLVKHCSESMLHNYVVQFTLHNNALFMYYRQGNICSVPVLFCVLLCILYNYIYRSFLHYPIMYSLFSVKPTLCTVLNVQFLYYLSNIKLRKTSLVPSSLLILEKFMSSLVILV